MSDPTPPPGRSTTQLIRETAQQIDRLQARRARRVAEVRRLDATIESKQRTLRELVLNRAPLAPGLLSDDEDLVP